MNPVRMNRHSIRLNFMKKLQLFCLAAMLFALFGFLKFDRGVRDGVYYSESQPNIQLRIDRSLRYLGEIDHMRGRLKAHAYIWLTPEPTGPGMDKMFIVEHSTVSQEVAYLTAKDLFRGMPAFDKGRSEIGGETYQYVYYITEPQGKNFWTEFIRSKGFVLNKPMLTACFGKISTDAAWTKFYYMRSYDPARYFRTETLTDEDRGLMRDYMERFREDVKYRGKYKK